MRKFRSRCSASARREVICPSRSAGCPIPPPPGTRGTPTPRRPAVLVRGDELEGDGLARSHLVDRDRAPREPLELGRLLREQREARIGGNEVEVVARGARELLARKRQVRACGPVRVELGEPRGLT